MLLGPLMAEGEVIKKLDVATVGWEELLDIRIGVFVTDERTAVVFNVVDGLFRVYDNDSPERGRGTYGEKRADEISDAYATGYCVALLSDGSDLSALLGPAITTMVRRPQREHAARPREEAVEPRRTRQRAGPARPRPREAGGTPRRVARQRTLDAWF